MIQWFWSGSCLARLPVKADNELELEGNREAALEITASLLVEELRSLTGTDQTSSSGIGGLRWLRESTCSSFSWLGTENSFGESSNNNLVFLEGTTERQKLVWLGREAAVVASASIALATRALASEAGLEALMECGA